jgi:hypothetical protein
MYEPLPSRTKELHAMSRQTLTVAVELLAGHTTLSAICINFKSHSSRIADCAGTKKKIVYILYVIVWHWHAKDREL